MRSAKLAFLQSGQAKAWAAVVGSESFETACEYALLQLLSEMTPNVEPGKAADAYAGMDANAQMHGAARVLAILSTIANPIESPKKTARETLHYSPFVPKPEPETKTHP